MNFVCNHFSEALQQSVLELNVSIKELEDEYERLKSDKRNFIFGYMRKISNELKSKEMEIIEIDKQIFESESYLESYHQQISNL